MPPDHREPESCPERRPLPGGRHACGLLLELAGPIEPGLAVVERAACLACRREFAPSTRDLNPVVASLLYGLSGRLALAGGDGRAARDLLELAARNLPDETDLARGSDTSRRGLEDLLPRPPARTGPLVRRWSVGVTTSARPSPTLAACLSSLAAAGWDSPRLFVDGPLAIPPEFGHLALTRREPLVGAWPSYYLALAELAMREPEADAYLLVQDDAYFREDAGLRPYLESILWPGEGPGVASLYCSAAYDRPGHGWRRFEGRWVWGAVSFVFSREAAQRFLADPGVVSHRWDRARDPLSGIDRRIGEWALAAGVPVYYPSPSLVQHIGHTSTLWPGERSFHLRRASRFAGEEPGP